MSIRSAIFWLHLAVGLTMGVFILIMSVTGVLLTYERQMLRAAQNAAITAPADAAIAVHRDHQGYLRRPHLFSPVHAHEGADSAGQNQTRWITSPCTSNRPCAQRRCEPPAVRQRTHS